MMKKAARQSCSTALKTIPHQDLRCGTVYIPLSRYSTSRGPAPGSGASVMMRYIFAVSAAHAGRIFIAVNSLMDIIRIGLGAGLVREVLLAIGNHMVMGGN